MTFALRYLSGNVREWWMVYSESVEGQEIYTQREVNTALLSRVEAIKKERIVLDELARWKQVKDFSAFNNDLTKYYLMFQTQDSTIKLIAIHVA